MGKTDAEKEKIARIKSYYFAGRNYERADLRRKDLVHANFTCSNFRAADLSGADLRGANFTNADLSRACLHGANCEGAIFNGADLTGAYCKGVKFDRAQLWHTCFKGAILKNATFFEADMVGADLARAECLGARFDGANTEGVKNVDRAIFRWFLHPQGGKPCYDPFPGAIVLQESILGTVSLQENAGMMQSGRGYLPIEDGYSELMADGTWKWFPAKESSE